MSRLYFNEVRSILCLGAHPDDIEIGCGATLSTMLSQKGVSSTWIVFSGAGVRADEARKSANCWMSGHPDCRVEILDFSDGFFPAQWESIKNEFRRISETINPDLIFTHYLYDRHQDHRTLAELTWQTFRSHTILEYEIPKYEGDLSQPNCYFPIDPERLNEKIERLLDFHQSQAKKPWFDAESFRGIARIRGIECGVKYAEAFHARKMIVG